MNEEEIILKTQHTNKHGEVMNLILDIQGKTWFNHEDCNGEEYADIETLYTDFTFGEHVFKDRFSYVLDSDEVAVLNTFRVAAKEICKQLNTYQKFWGVEVTE